VNEERNKDAEALDLTECDREPIHIPGAIQPHGLLLIVDAATFSVIGGAGDIETRLGSNWLQHPLNTLLGKAAKAQLETCTEPATAFSLDTANGKLEVTARRSATLWLLQIEPLHEVETSTQVLMRLDQAGIAFERAAGLDDLCDCAAHVFADLTGFDRVMVYRFLGDDTGVVVAERCVPGLNSFLNHHFPAWDIPRQARALYIRNRVRVIPDVHYTPAPLRPSAFASLDLSDIDIRSVSPIHLQYLKNMDVAASASISIVKDGVLWGLIACHHRTPRGLSPGLRLTCQALASGLARQIQAKEEAEAYRERLRLRSEEDAVVAHLGRAKTLAELFSASANDLRRMLDAHGFAAVTASEIFTTDACPQKSDIAVLAQWLKEKTALRPFHTDELGKLFEPALAYQDKASGLIAVALSVEDPLLLLWFRAEHLEVVRWAGNPHKAVAMTPGSVLTPRASFEAWSEEKRGKAQSWSQNEIEAVHRIARFLFEARQTQRIRDLVRELSAAVDDKDRLLLQKEHLLKEMNHRVQNSLALVSAFLALQAKSSSNEIVAANLGEAQRRLSAVALVHQRLYNNDKVETIDLSRYLEELCTDLKTSMGEDWAKHISLNLAPILVSADTAINVGLILNELLTNVAKYAYRGAPGPVSVSLEEMKGRFRLIVSDRGGGKTGTRQGFGTRVLTAMVERLRGTLEEESSPKGLRTIVTAPI